MTGTQYVLGINAYDHDVSACLLRDGEIVAAIASGAAPRMPALLTGTSGTSLRGMRSAIVAASGAGSFMRRSPSD